MKLFLVILLWLVVILSYGQHFDASYKVAQIPNNSSLYTPLIDVQIDSLNTRLTNEDKSKFKEKLLGYILETRNNLLDTSLHLEVDYNAIWPGFYDTYLGEINTLISFLKTGFIAQQLQWVPDPGALQSYLDSFAKVSIEPSRSSSFRQKEIRLYTRDAFRSWLFGWMKEKIYTNPFPFQEINIEYKTAWRELEKLYSELPGRRDSLMAFRDTMYSIKEFQDFYTIQKLQFANILRNLSKNPIVEYFNNDNILRKVSWFNGGLIHMNPLLVTSNDRKYPIREMNSFYSSDFTRFSDSLEKVEWLKELFTTKQLTNKVILPIKNSVDSTFDEETMLIQYDANNDYAFSGIFNKYVYKKDSIIIAVHNIPIHKSIDFKVSLNKKEDQGRQVTALNEFLTPIGDLVKFFIPLAGAAGRVLSPFQPAALIGSQGIPIPNVQQVQLASTHSMSESFKANNNNNTRIKIAGRVFTPAFANPVQVKKDIILTAFFESAHITPNNFMKELIDDFADQDSAILNFNDAQSTRKLLENFKFFLAKSLDNLIYSTIVLYSKTQALVRISNRSLPPKEISTKENNNPLFRSEVRKEIIGKPTQEMGIVVVENSKEPKDQREVAEYSFTLARKTKWDVSVGIAYTYFKSFNTITSSGNSLPLVEPAKHLHFIGTLHYYPKGMTKIDDDPLPLRWERVSFFAGLSFDEPLDNYYGGISYDIVPGIRAMLGVQFYQNRRFKIINDEVDEKASALKMMGPCVSFSLAPITIVGNILGLFK